MIDVAVVGASGYIGGELLRLLLDHREVRVGAAVSARLAGSRVDRVHPNLRGRTDLTFTAPDELGDHDVVFVAVSQTAGLELVPRLRDRAKCLIDLGADFRLRDPRAYRRYYGTEHTAPELLDSFVPGVPEIHRAELAVADTISMPGCMAIASILALRPLAEAGVVAGPVTVDGRIGSSGSGVRAEQMNLHAERSGTMRLFAPTGHRHEAEIAQATGVRARMSATGVEAVRGAQVVCRVPVREPLDDKEVRRLYRGQYQDEPFVRIIAQRRGLYRLPEPKILSGTNYCDVGFAADPETSTVVAVAALDNLVKGGAGGAVQCMNVRMGWPERLGLEFPGLHPV
ncbi:MULTISPECIES: N-acetyl-gamma-glutamyl-phosphate reductase [Streptomyces]|uniref:N-acetyl-gamma-glutamyl-phosphate reductase n=1 Tax=Streptomyces TaxID=1883 RepID=UPI002109306A|nr:N-acetyl-gamma-glutamyl-phosphate reductase [Streptomyces longispororuber]MCQ4206672.1 N-acetyl-gamma-glutamyl-phosphate reductase [Streptomyces longispororuber]